MIEIKPMENSHIEDVLFVETSCFLIPWTKNDFIREINENKMAIYRVALCDGKVVGYAGMWHVINEGHITNVAVLEQYRNCLLYTSICKENRQQVTKRLF